MFRSFWMSALALGAGLMLAPAVGLAQCQSCQSDSCNGGWPSSGSSHGSRFQALHDWHDDYHQKAQVIARRNSAWPRPFACQDRMGYFSTIAAMYESGWIAQCTLTDVHFDPASGQLSEAGLNKLHAILANNPLDRRTVFVLHDRDIAQSEKRLETVRNRIGQWYGPDLANNVALTDRLPHNVSGQRIETINAQYRATMPPPMIQMGNSSGSTTSSGN